MAPGRDGAVTSLAQHLPGVDHRGNDWKDRLGRVGLVGKGTVYLIVGLLALQLATGDLSTEPSKTGAFEWLADQPFGRVLLVALTVCLFAMAAWRLLDAAVGDPVDGDEAHDRLRFAAKGLLYLGFAVAALGTTLAHWSGSTSGGTGGGAGGGGEAQQQEQATATVLSWPGGPLLVGAAGLGFISYALYMAKRHPVDQRFLDRLDAGSSSWVAPVGRVGYAARSVVFALVGWFLVQAAVTYDPEQAKGVSAALRELAGEGWGPAALWVVAIGLMAYGLFNVAEAWLRRAA